ncbi:MAG: hypothetical protein CFE34_15960 [Rhodobacteraceae bacterium PARR1]|nr:MAG: hypothetical protein CFE34_15960 [Rhodobacteraceae bacterium PARR1]
MVPSFALSPLPLPLRHGAVPDDPPSGGGDFAAILAGMAQGLPSPGVTAGPPPADGPRAEDRPPDSAEDDPRTDRADQALGLAIAVILPPPMTLADAAPSGASAPQSGKTRGATDTHDADGLAATPWPVAMDLPAPMDEPAETVAAHPTKAEPGRWDQVSGVFLVQTPAVSGDPAVQTMPGRGFLTARPDAPDGPPGQRPPDQTVQVGHASRAGAADSPQPETRHEAVQATAKGSVLPANRAESQTVSRHLPDRVAIQIDDAPSRPATILTEPAPSGAIMQSHGALMGLTGPAAALHFAPIRAFAPADLWRNPDAVSLPIATPTRQPRSDHAEVLTRFAAADRDASTDATPTPKGVEGAAQPAPAPPAMSSGTAQQHSVAGEAADRPTLPDETRAILRQIAPPTADHDGTVEIALFPKGLGQVRLDIQQGPMGAHIVISADRPETLNLIRRHSADLIAEFRGAGMTNPVLSFASTEGQPPPRQDPSGPLANGTLGGSSQHTGQHSGGSPNGHPAPHHAAPKGADVAEWTDPAPPPYRSDPAPRGVMILRL